MRRSDPQRSWWRPGLPGWPGRARTGSCSETIGFQDAPRAASEAALALSGFRCAASRGAATEEAMDARYTTKGGVRVQRRSEALPYPLDVEAWARALDERRGLLLASSCEVPGRYARYDLGLVDPPLALTARGRALEVEALSPRGRVLLPALAGALRPLRALERLEEDEARLRACVRAPAGSFTEEERSR